MASRRWLGSQEQVLAQFAPILLRWKWANAPSGLLVVVKLCRLASLKGGVVRQPAEVLELGRDTVHEGDAGDLSFRGSRIPRARRVDR
jgi:hypothetical protein